MHSNLSESEVLLQKQIESFGSWMYKFQFTPNVSSQVMRDDVMEAVETRKKMIFNRLDDVFKNKWGDLSCLDVGCSEGHTSFELVKKGVKKITGFDARQKNIEKANFVKNYFHFDNVNFFIDDVETVNVDQLGTFDLVFFLGLLYHLENPMLVLRKMRKLSKTCIIETQVNRHTEEITLGWGLKKLERTTQDVLVLLDEPIDNQGASITGLSIIPNKSALIAMLRHVGFSKIEILPPIDNAYETYAKNDRIIILAE